MSNLTAVTDANFDNQVVQANLPTLVDFWAEWCGPCKRLTPILEKIAAEYAGKLVIVQVNADENPDTPARFGIMGLPTLLLFKNGEIVETLVGYASKDRLLSKITPHLMGQTPLDVQAHAW